MTGVVSVDGCWQRGMTWAGGLAGLGLVSVGRRGWAWSAGVGVGGVLSVGGHWGQGLVWAAWMGGQCGRAWAGMDGWVQAASAPDSVLIEYYKVTQKRLFLITLVY